MVRAAQHDQKLIAAHAGHRVLLAHALLQPFRHHLQQLVAKGVTQRVIDVLESVQIEKQHRQLFTLPPCAGQSTLQPIHEERPVGQAGQGIVIGQEVDLRLGCLPVGDVLSGPLKQHDLSRRIAHRPQIHHHPEPAAILPIELHFRSPHDSLGSGRRGRFHHALRLDKQLRRRIGDLRQQFLRRIVAVHLCERLVDVDGPAVGRVLENSHHCVVENGAVFFFRLPGRLLGARARGHIVGGHQHRLGFLKLQVVTHDFDIDDRAVLPAVFPDPRFLQSVTPSRHVQQQIGNRFGRPDIGDGHAQEFRFAVPVLANGRTVHRKEMEGPPIENPHGDGIALKEHPILRIRPLKRLVHTLTVGDWRRRRCVRVSPALLGRFHDRIARNVATAVASTAHPYPVRSRSPPLSQHRARRSPSTASVAAAPEGTAQFEFSMVIGSVGRVR